MKVQISITVTTELMNRLVELKTDNHLKTLGNAVDFLNRENNRLKILCDKQRKTLNDTPGTEEYAHMRLEGQRKKPFIGPQARA